MVLERGIPGFKICLKKKVKGNLSQTKLSKLLARQQWSELMKHISSNPDILNSPDRDESFFHEICRFQPPLHVVEEIVGLSPSSLVLENDLGQFPLHVAAQNGASPEVISYLCKSNTKSSGVQDNMGKTPLHLASESYANKYTHQQDRKLPLEEALLLTVKILIRSSPHTVNLEDADDISVLEYAIDSDVDLKVIRVIQKASEKDWKKRSTRGKKHASIESNLQGQFQVLASGQ
mmetsp:Transcript_3428/g.3239  ORF Transcript_3428/g.3239 Transcript_3428/m.3239 type:complete len:234 (-) Transcript_3428:40-741(-)